jgi:3-phenylpropionate/trans-cinnamate dioxygenase ferredoxin subunit
LSDWVDVGDSASIRCDSHTVFEVEGYVVRVVRVADTLYAFEDRCTHDDGALDDAEIDGTQVICPRHGARFCLRTGEVLAPPAYEPLKIFAVRELDGRLQIGKPS